jgi:nucleoside-diphosphate-sugar epimerase
MQRVLITGATGFVGRPLCAALASSDCEVIACARTFSADVACSRFISCNLDVEFLADDHFAGVDTVIFLAGIAHAGRNADIAARRYQRVNCEAAVQAARTALRCGVRHFHYVSSVKAMGYESSTQLLRETDGVEPQDAYGKSKRAAEQQLLSLANGIPMKITISRPVLVYGAGVKGNLQRLARLASTRWLPRLPRIGQRSMIALPDLVAALQQFVRGYGRHGEIYILAGDASCAADMVADMRRYLDENSLDESRVEANRVTQNLLDQNGVGRNDSVRGHFGRAMARLTVPLPVFRMLALMGDTCRRWRLPTVWDSEQYQKLFGDLQFDAGKARETLEWRPQHRFCDLIPQMVGKSPR